MCLVNRNIFILGRQGIQATKDVSVYGSSICYSCKLSSMVFVRVKISCIEFTTNRKSLKYGIGQVIHPITLLFVIRKYIISQRSDRLVCKCSFTPSLQADVLTEARR
jgi:hypothetical protein